MDGCDAGFFAMMKHVDKLGTLRIICAVALLLLGFSQPAYAAVTDSPYDIAYQLPDGTFASICQDGNHGGSPDGDSNHCRLCLAAAGHLFVPPAESLAFRLRIDAPVRFFALREAQFRREPCRQGLSRAPPLSA